LLAALHYLFLPQQV